MCQLVSFTKFKVPIIDKSPCCKGYGSTIGILNMVTISVMAGAGEEKLPW